MILGWVLCDCPGVQDNPAGYGHHQVRCIAGCTSVWYDPPHTKQAASARSASGRFRMPVSAVPLRLNS